MLGGNRARQIFRLEAERCRLYIEPMQGIEASWAAKSSVSTLKVPQADRIGYWEEVNATVFAGARCSTFDTRGLMAGASTVHSGLLTINDIRGNEHVIERTPELVRSTPKNSIFACLLLEGNAFFYQNNKCINLNVGDLLIYDTESPFLYGFPGQMRELLIDLPRDEFLKSLAIAGRIDPIYFDSSIGIGRTLSGAVRRMTLSAMASGSHAERTRLFEILSSVVGGSKSRRSAILLLMEAKSIIAENLTNPDLDTAFACKRMRLSVRHLNRLFEAENTSVARYIRSERLKKAYRDLSTMNSATVAEIAQRWGFSDLSSFSRAFRQEFGKTATDVRVESRLTGADWRNPV